MKQEFIKVAILSSMSAVCLVTLLIISLSSPLIMGEDPYSLLRYVLIRLTAIVIAVPVLTGLMVAVDYVTPSNWMEAIGNDPKACSYIMAAVVLVIGAVLCWT
jgi:hypothetical protein